MNPLTIAQEYYYIRDKLVNSIEDTFDEGETVCCHGLQLTEPHFLQPDVVVVVHVVDANDADSVVKVQQLFDEIAADESGGTGHHDIAV